MPGTTPRGATQLFVDVALLSRAVAVTSPAHARQLMPTRGVTFARYLRKVHIEWCPFKPKAVGPIFFGEIHTKQIFDAVPKLAITKALVAAPTKEGAPFVDQAKFTFADGSEKTLDFTGIHVRDVLEELDGDNVRIQVEERKRGRPFS